MQAEYVAPTTQVVQAHHLGPHRVRLLRGQVGVRERHVEIVAREQFAGEAPHVRSADQADPLADVSQRRGVQRDLETGVALPGGEPHQTLVGQHDRRSRELGDRDGVGGRRTGHEDATVPDRMGHLPLHRSRPVREQLQVGHGRHHVGCESRTSPVTDEHLHLREHREHTRGCEIGDRFVVQEHTHPGQLLEVTRHQCVAEETVHHRQRYPRPPPDLVVHGACRSCPAGSPSGDSEPSGRAARTSRFNAASVIRSGRCR